MPHQESRRPPVRLSQCPAVSDSKKFRRGNNLLIKPLRIPVHHDRIIAKLLANTALIHRPQTPQKSAEGNISVVNEPLLGRRFPVQVELDQLLDLKIIIIRIDRAHAHIDQRIAHAGVLPVDQAEIPVRQEQEVVAHAVDMGQDLRPVQVVEAVKQCHHMGLYFRIILKKLLLVSTAQCLIEGDPLPDIKRIVHMELRIMELLHKCHAPCHIIPVALLRAPS